MGGGSVDGDESVREEKVKHVFNMWTERGRPVQEENGKVVEGVECNTVHELVRAINHAEGTGYRAIPNSFPLTDSRGVIFDAWAYTPWCGDYITGVWKGSQVRESPIPRKQLWELMRDSPPSYDEFCQWPSERKKLYRPAKVCYGQNVLNKGRVTFIPYPCIPPVVNVPPPTCSCGGDMVHIRTGERTPYRKVHWTCRASLRLIRKRKYELIECQNRVSVEQVNIAIVQNHPFDPLSRPVNAEEGKRLCLRFKYVDSFLPGPACNICGLQMRSFISRGIREHHGRPYWFCGGTEDVCHGGGFRWVDECENQVHQIPNT